jgi:uncharacterized cupredoxin-like copper-binding protein
MPVNVIRRAIRRATAALAAFTLALAGCSPGATATPTVGTPTVATPTEGTPTSPPATAAGSEAVQATVQEFSVTAEPATASAGEVTFEVTNDGPDDPHEFVVIKTDLAPDALPTDDTGAVDEEGDGIEVIDEIEEFAPGETEALTVTLEAGSYVLICNVFEESENESHYENGMHTAFTVQ